MIALVANHEARRKDGELISYPMAQGAHIFKGALVCLNPQGYAIPATDTANLRFIGVAYDEIDNHDGADGGARVRVLKSGTYVVARSNAIPADLGTIMFIVDDATVASDTTNDIAVGAVVEVPDAAHVRICINNQVR